MQAGRRQCWNQSEFRYGSGNEARRKDSRLMVDERWAALEK